MAESKIKISQMSAAITANAADTLMIIQDGANKKASLTTLLKNLNSNDSIRINPIQFAVNFTVSSKNDANAITVIGSSDRIGFGTNNPQSKVHVAGNMQVGSNAIDGVLVQSSEDISYLSSDQTNAVVKSLSPLRAGSILSCATGVSGLFSLPAGSNGQIKTIVVAGLDIGKTITITTAGIGFNLITLNAVGKTAVLQYWSSTSKWALIGGNNAAISTV